MSVNASLRRHYLSETFRMELSCGLKYLILPAHPTPIFLLSSCCEEELTRGHGSAYRGAEPALLHCSNCGGRAPEWARAPAGCLTVEQLEGMGPRFLEAFGMEPLVSVVAAARLTELTAEVIALSQRRDGEAWAAKEQRVQKWLQELAVVEL